MQLGGLIPGSEYDVLNVTGDATIAGNVEIMMIDLSDLENNSNPFAPAPGDSFDVVRAASVANNGYSLVELNPIDGQSFVDSIVDIAGGRQALRLTVGGTGDGFVRSPGDSNEDREFGTADIVAVLAAGKFETGQPATWVEGDWNGAPNASITNGPPLGDGVFDTTDIVAALSTGFFETGRYAATSPLGEDASALASVPEPAGAVLVCVGNFGLLLRRARRWG